MSNEAIDALRARVAGLESEAKLREQVARLEQRIARGPSPGSPAAMKFREPPRSIGGVGSDWDRVRAEWLRAGNYEAL